MAFYYFIILVFGLIFIRVILFRIIEPAHMLFFNKPLYIYFYPFPKKLEPNQKKILLDEFLFYDGLSKKKQKYFEHRVKTVVNNYQFIGNEGIEVTDEMKIIIAGTYVMLTFGMRHYLVTLFTKIILYPSIYYSKSNDQNHKGEFNPMMKAIVFSWEDFLLGHKTANDNLNLGVHEFSHVLHFHCLKSNDPSAIIFYDEFTKISNYFFDINLNNQLVETGYFRDYAYTNQFEFLAVVLEHYFETPMEFRLQFPELYSYVSKMLNQKE